MEKFLQFNAAMGTDVNAAVISQSSPTTFTPEAEEASTDHGDPRTRDYISNIWRADSCRLAPSTKLMPISILPVIPSPPKTFQDEAKNKAVNHTSSIFIVYGSLKPVHDGKTSTGSTAKWPVFVSAQESNLCSNRDNSETKTAKRYSFLHLFTDSCVWCPS